NRFGVLPQVRRANTITFHRRHTAAPGGQTYRKQTDARIEIEDIASTGQSDDPCGERRNEESVRLEERTDVMRERDSRVAHDQLVVNMQVAVPVWSDRGNSVDWRRHCPALFPAVFNPERPLSSGDIFSQL